MITKCGKTFKILQKIDQGAFGQIYQAICTGNNKKVAIKIQSTDAKHPQIVYQCRIYNNLHSNTSVIDKGIPQVYFCATQGNYSFLVMQMLGPSLESLFLKREKKFSLKTVLMIMDQMIARIQFVHNNQYIHRDIKPDNFCMGPVGGEKANSIYLIDFGLSKKYIQRDGTHIPYKQGKNLTGTARYASVNTHIGIEQSCRDDLESIGYVIVYFLKGILPWQGLKAVKKQDKYERIKQKKLNTSVKKLTEGLPAEFYDYMTTVRELKFDAKPNYTALRKKFQNLLAKNGYRCDYQYDWVLPPEKTSFETNLTGKSNSLFKTQKGDKTDLQ